MDSRIAGGPALPPPQAQPVRPAVADALADDPAARHRLEDRPDPQNPSAQPRRAEPVPQPVPAQDSPASRRTEASVGQDPPSGTPAPRRAVPQGGVEVPPESLLRGRTATDSPPAAPPARERQLAQAGLASAAETRPLISTSA